MCQQAASLLFRLASYGYERGSLLTTTNKRVQD
jgi:hypothetical protein